MRIGIDATPLLGHRTGVGTYVAHLTRSFTQLYPDDEVVATAFTLRGAGELARAVPPGVSHVARRVPARLLRAAWGRTEWPPVRLLTGRVDVFHGTNFVLPPERRPGVVTVHDLAFLLHPDTVSTESARLRDMVPRSLRRAAAVCVPSAAVAEEVRTAYPSAGERVLVTPLGVDPAWAQAAPLPPERRAALGLDRPYLLFVGTVEPRKNLAVLLQAFGQICSLEPDPPLLALAGPAGWGAPPDVPAVARPHVVGLGYLPVDELRSVVAGAQALAFPSRYEGFGLPPLEAFATGVPVVASDIPAVRATVGAEAGLARFFPATDADALADALREPWPDECGGGPATRRRALASEYTWSRTAALTRQAYERATGSRRP